MGLERMIHNATSWDYPMPLHEELCCELRINPEVYILPGFTRRLLTDHFTLEDYVETEAFSDEVGNVVYFFEEHWTKEYRLWLVHHEMFHQSQYYDKGNYRGDRWNELNQKQRSAQWEKEADLFADERVGTLDDGVKRYCVEPEDPAEPFVKRFLGGMQQKTTKPRLLIRGHRR